MSDCSYTISITKVMKALGLSSSWVLYIGTGIDTSALELEEIWELYKRDIGNRKAIICGKHYNTKLPLSAIRALSGQDSAINYSKDTRSTFYCHTCTSTQPVIPMGGWTNDFFLEYRKA